MNYKDYYKVLDIKKDANLADIKKAYRKLAHLYHPDITKDPQGEEKFKDIAEAYSTLKNPEKRAEYDSLGSHQAGDQFTPSPEWRAQNGGDEANFDDVDFSDFIHAFRSGRTEHRQRRNTAVRGEDFSVPVSVPLEMVFHGGGVDVAVEIPEQDERGLLHRKQRIFRITIPKGAHEGQRMRLSGKAGPGRFGGQPGDLYVVLTIAPHRIFRISESDLYFDLPLAPWEAVLGLSLQVPTPAGVVELTVKPGTTSGQRLRLSKRGLPKVGETFGDLYAVIQIQIPKECSQVEQELYQQLSDLSHFQPRAYFKLGGA